MAAFDSVSLPGAARLPERNSGALIVSAISLVILFSINGHEQRGEEQEVADQYETDGERHQQTEHPDHHKGGRRGSGWAPG